MMTEMSWGVDEEVNQDKNDVKLSLYIREEFTQIWVLQSVFISINPLKGTLRPQSHCIRVVCVVCIWYSEEGP